jgi:uncharacterized protein (DUF362 family)
MCTLEKKPVLNVVDAYRLLKDNGPQGKSEADVYLSKALFLSQDIVAVDTAAAKLCSDTHAMPPCKIGYFMPKISQILFSIYTAPPVLL